MKSKTKVRIVMVLFVLGYAGLILLFIMLQLKNKEIRALQLKQERFELETDLTIRSAVLSTRIKVTDSLQAEFNSRPPVINIIEQNQNSENEKADSILILPLGVKYKYWSNYLDNY